ncbi:MAG: hypothetical protein WC802_01665 [Patescibacteria group bacterium]
MNITPGILAKDENDCKTKLQLAELKNERFHLDALDNTLVHGSCWADPNIIGTWKELPEIEIHLMVTHPARHATIWKTRVPTLKNVIIPAEAIRDPQRMCEKLKLMGLTVTIAINPKTPVEAFNDMKGCADELLIMGVEPGASGQPFLGEVILAKIMRARALFPNLSICVDGGVNTKSIQAIANAGATRAIATSAIWKSASPLEELQRLESML